MIKVVGFFNLTEQFNIVNFLNENPKHRDYDIPG
jgi:hypothetical protein